MSTFILGLSAFYHDSAAALLADGNIIAAAQEERFTRKKHDFNFPKQAVDYCLREAGIQPEDLNYVPSKPPARKKRAGLFRKFIGMMRENKKYWLVPLVLIPLLFAGLIILGPSLAVSRSSTRSFNPMDLESDRRECDCARYTSSRTQATTVSQAHCLIHNSAPRRSFINGHVYCGVGCIVS